MQSTTAKVFLAMLAGALAQPCFLLQTKYDANFSAATDIASINDGATCRTQCRNTSTCVSYTFFTTGPTAPKVAKCYHHTDPSLAVVSMVTPTENGESGPKYCDDNPEPNATTTVAASVSTSATAAPTTAAPTAPPVTAAPVTTTLGDSSGSGDSSLPLWLLGLLLLCCCCLLCLAIAGAAAAMMGKKKKTKKVRRAPRQETPVETAPLMIETYAVPAVYQQPQVMQTVVASPIQSYAPVAAAPVATMAYQVAPAMAY